MDDATPTSARAWISSFLSRRNLSLPDGRSLYAYKCSVEEFGELRAVLTRTLTSEQTNDSVVSALTLYGSEWWRRNFSGGSWSWEPILESIEWRREYHELYAVLRKAWGWWGIEPVLLNAQVRYLGTFACQGGLPLRLVAEEGANVRSYLRALLREYRRFRSVVSDGYELASDLQTYLPRSLRQEAVYRLCADLLDQIWAMRDIVRDAPNAIARLDSSDSEWRSKMPINLEDETAVALIDALLIEASKHREQRSAEFAITRSLVNTASGFRFTAKVNSPPVMPLKQFSKLLGSDAKLPSRFDIRIGADAIKPVSIARLTKVDGEESVVFSVPSTPFDYLSGLVTEELIMSVHAGTRIGGSFTPRAGGALTDLPWIFVDPEGDGERYELYCEGSVSTRYPEVVVAFPDALCGQLEQIEAVIGWDQAKISGRSFFRVVGDCSVETDSGTIRILVGAETESRREHALTGKRFFNAQARVPLFRGAPELFEIAEDRPRRRVEATELQWKNRVGDFWINRPDTHGLWTVRRVADGVVVYSERIGILPEEFSMRLHAGELATKGAIVFENCGELDVGSEHIGIECEVVHHGPHTTVVLEAKSSEVASSISLFLKWGDSGQLQIDVPFPGRGARFEHSEHKFKLGQHLRVSDLHGWRAVVVSPDTVEGFRLFGELRAVDLDSVISRIAYFEIPIPLVSDHLHSLPLFEIGDICKQLFAVSSDLDACVELTIKDQKQEVMEKIGVARFGAEIQNEENLFWIADSDDLRPEDVIVEAFSFYNPSYGLVPLQTEYSVGAIRGWSAPRAIQDGHTWLVTARRGDDYFARPAILAGSPVDVEAPTSLCDAAEIPDAQKRTDAFASIYDSMSEAYSEEENWEYVQYLIDESIRLPPTTFTALDCLVSHPRVLVRLLFRSNESVRHRLWTLDRELPFSWLLIPAEVWSEEASSEYRRMAEALESIEGGRGIAMDHISLVLSEGVEINPTLTIAKELAMFQIQGSSALNLLRIASDPKNLTILLQRRQAAYQNVLRADRSWPPGPSREDWHAEIPGSKDKGWDGLWIDCKGTGFRMPLSDAPIGAAMVCASGSGVSSPLIHASKFLREFDSAWFDDAYVLTLAILASALVEEDK